MIDKRKKAAQGVHKLSIKQAQVDKSKSLAFDGNPAKSIHSKTNANYTNELSEDSHKVRLLNSLTARKNPFADLVRISLLLNPREYELPEDYVPNIQFPGTSKKFTISSNSATREARLTSYSVKRAQELDRNNLPLILRTCYFCRRGCRKAPLIHCDYCPLVYHADCIDPPLTVLPNTRWMCPNHVEPIAEEKLLSTSSFCERVKLWNHFSQPVDQESIKISFLDRVHSSSSPEPESSQFVKLGTKVPKCIKREYEKFIIDIEKYEPESEDDVETAHDQRDADTNNCLYDMIESSKILESQEYLSTNTTSAPLSHSVTTDEEAIEKKEWLEFINKLSSSEVKINNHKPVEASVKQTSTTSTQEQVANSLNRFDANSTRWSNNNVCITKNHNFSFNQTRSREIGNE